MSRGMFSGFILAWTASPKKSPHANKKADPCKAILLAFALFALEKRGKGQRVDCGFRIRIVDFKKAGRGDTSRGRGETARRRHCGLRN